jgi:SAM-dependent methyltransferase
MNLQDPYDWWERTYEGASAEELPWFSPTPDHDLLPTLQKYAPKPGTALDLGSGPGTHAIALARLGWQVTAVDISPSAIRMASRFAQQAAVQVNFQPANILTFRPNPSSFDLVHDRGFLHTLEPAEWPKWLNLVAAALKVGGLLMAKEFTYDPVRHDGPRGFTKAELQSILDERFMIESIEDSWYAGPSFRHAAILLLARRKADSEVRV